MASVYSLSYTRTHGVRQRMEWGDMVFAIVATYRAIGRAQIERRLRW